MSYNDLDPDQQALAAYMSELSEQSFSAGWMEDLEHALWHSVAIGPFRYGNLNLTREYARKLKELSDACGGWIRFDDRREEMFVPLTDWIDRYYDSERASR